jgi:hypothetical protein
LELRHLLLSSVIGVALLSAGFMGYFIGSDNAPVSDAQLTDSIQDAFENDEVTIMVHDSQGNLKSEQKVSNIITSAGAIWFCIEQNRCTSQITGATAPNVAAPTWWIQFISGTPNTNEPTAADCTSPSGGGTLTGQSPNIRCVTNFGAAPAQYQAGGSVVTVSATAGSGQLRGSGTFDTTNNFVQSTRATVCSIVDDGTAPSSGTCQFTDTTPVLTNMSGSSITVRGLALNSGTASNTVAGPLMIAESLISATTLAPGDTISVSWTIVT